MSAPFPDPADQPVPYALTAEAEAELDSWDSYLQLSPELEAEAGL